MIERELCRHPEAVVCFTLMDYDVITSNDFGGEAFLPLSAVCSSEPGLAAADNFHGLKPIHLPLIFQHQKGGNNSLTECVQQCSIELKLCSCADHPILKALEVRSSDKTAQEFVKRQRRRCL